jgi:2-aminoadipate transaminase
LKRSNPKLIYIVADFQNPKGTSLSEERREQLVELARRYRVPIVEDDPYGELQYGISRPRTLAARDEDGMVIYLSTFSKTLSPGMRIGWVAASDEVIQALVIAKQPTDLHTCTIQQRAVAKMLESFDYDGHIARLREVYGGRCRAMLTSIESHFPAETRWTRPDGGLFLWVELPEAIRDYDLLAAAVSERVAFVPGAPFFAEEARHNFIRLNFSNCPPDRIEEGIKRIGGALKRGLG